MPHPFGLFRSEGLTFFVDFENSKNQQKAGHWEAFLSKEPKKFQGDFAKQTLNIYVFENHRNIWDLINKIFTIF